MRNGPFKPGQLAFWKTGDQMHVLQSFSCVAAAKKMTYHPGNRRRFLKRVFGILFRKAFVFQASKVSFLTKNTQWPFIHVPAQFWFSWFHTHKFKPLGECKHCGVSLEQHTPFLWMGTNSCPFKEISRSLASCETKPGWRCEGKARSRKDEMAVRGQGSNFVSRPFCGGSIFRFGCLLSAFEHDLQALPNDLRRSMANQSRKRNFGRQ